MARKVFISFLGANPYGDCHYVKPGSDYEISNPYIQIATLDYLDKHVTKWEKGDIALILLTDEAEKKNWLPHDLTNPKTKEITGHERGLELRMKEMNLPFSIVPINNLPEGDTVQETMTIFMKTFEKLQEGDELYFDITHGFRFLPMLVMVLTNYSKFTKTCKVKWISYGKTVPPFKEGSIIDLSTLSVLQDWTTGAADFVDNGNVDKLTGLSKEEMSPILSEANGTNANANNISNFTKKLDLVINDIKMCRCYNIIEATGIKNLRDYSNRIDMSSVVQPFHPIVIKIMDSLKGFSSERRVYNGIEAAKWCICHSLYQQAITFLEETIVSFVCEKNDIELLNMDKRTIVTNSFDVLRDNKPENSWNLGKDESKFEEYKNLYRQILQDSFVREYYAIVCAIKDLRNDMNHAGMRNDTSTDSGGKNKKKKPKPNAMSADKLKEKIKEYIDIFSDLLKQDNITKNSSLKSTNIFLNLSNHPSTNWNEEQRTAALEFGEIKDLPFPNIDENLDEAGIDALTDDYLEKIKELSGNEPCTVHIMGEMTFTYALVNNLKAEGYTCIASTTKRDVEIMPDGSKQVKFHFCRFRKY